MLANDPKADIARSWLDLDWTSTPQALELIDGVREDPLRAAASTYCPSLEDPKGYMSCTRSGAHYDNRSPPAVACIHCNARCFCRPSLASPPSLRGDCSPGNTGK